MTPEFYERNKEELKKRVEQLRAIAAEERGGKTYSSEEVLEMIKGDDV